MSGWHILIRGAVCAAGVLAFLKLVAKELEVATEELRLLEDRERRRYEKRAVLEAKVAPQVAGRAPEAGLADGSPNT